MAVNSIPGEFVTLELLLVIKYLKFHQQLAFFFFLLKHAKCCIIFSYFTFIYFLIKHPDCDGHIIVE